MNLETIQDIVQLKALAYDQLKLKEQIEQNLLAITDRIVELTKQQQSNIDNTFDKSEELPANGGADDGQKPTE